MRRRRLVGLEAESTLEAEPALETESPLDNTLSPSKSYRNDRVVSIDFMVLR